MAEGYSANVPGSANDEARLTIKRFEPSAADPSVWAAIAPLAREWVEIVAPQTRDQAVELMSRTAAFLVWLYEQGVDLRPEVALAPSTLDRYVKVGCAHLAPGTRTNYRRLLRKIGRAVLGPPMYPERPLGLPKSDPSLPYTRDDEGALSAWVHGLPTERQRDGATALLGMGLGAGLRSREMHAARADWVESTATGTAITVPGAHPRRVPVVARWEWAIDHAVTVADSGLLFLPKRHSQHRKTVSAFTENLPSTYRPKLSVQRLRITWIVRHLDGQVSPNVLAAAAGVTPETLWQYVRSMSPVDTAEADRQLRGPDQ
jgi:hypothetical protein